LWGAKTKKNLDEYYKNNQWIDVFGNHEFEDMIKKITENKSKETINKQRTNSPTIDEIKRAVVKYYQVELAAIEKPIHMKENIPRSMAMWLARKVGKYSLRDVASAFSNSSYSSVSVAIWRLKKKAQNNIEIIESFCHLEKTLHK